jgi:hypothetical protein
VLFSSFLFCLSFLLSACLFMSRNHISIICISCLSLHSTALVSNDCLFTSLFPCVPLHVLCFSSFMCSLSSSLNASVINYNPHFSFLLMVLCSLFLVLLFKHNCLIDRISFSCFSLPTMTGHLSIVSFLNVTEQQMK